LIKLALEPQADAARHWRSEIVSFHGNMHRRYAPSMQHRISFADLWRLARDQAILGAERPEEIKGLLPGTCPFTLEEILADRLDMALMAERLASNRLADGDH
jgi:hypothetical protein